MKRLSFLAVFGVLVLSIHAFAQKAEVFGGYSYYRFNSGVAGLGSANLNGWNFALTGKFNKYVGVTADLGGGYGTLAGVNTHLHTFLFGPQVSASAMNVTVFGRVLAGVTHAESDNTLTTGFGGGIDYKVLPHVGVRVAQLDYVHTSFGCGGQNNVRYSAGVVLRF